MASTSSKPFGVALRALMDTRGMTYRELAEETRLLDGRGMTHAYINMLVKGHDKPSVRAMELIAQACGVPPDYFAEYRLNAAMRRTRPSRSGPRASARESQRSAREPSPTRRHTTISAAAISAY